MLYLDTSVLVAYYLPEQKSRKVERLLSGLAAAAISPLTEVEFHSALARRVRMKELVREDAQRALSQFFIHLKGRLFHFLPLQQREYELAREWLGSLDLPLRPLDALHLAVVFSNRLALATADLVFGKTARALGVEVVIV